MFENRKIVLFIEWSTSGRDFEIDLPLMYFFEKYLGWNVIYASIFNLPNILSIEPDLIIMSNTTGGVENVNMARLIERSSIPFFSHISEGVFRENDIEEFVWGWNKREKRFSELISGVWSKKSFDMAVSAYPHVQNTYKVSGAIGFDKYSIYPDSTVDVKKYSKVIGYAGFDFNNIKAKKDEFIRSRGAKGEKLYEDLMKKAQNINEILEFILHKNEDILLLFKPHPGDGSQEPMELKGLRGFENLKLIKEDISIVQAISSCDIWLNYNSTTNLEAWLLDKPTLTFNTDEKRFSSNIIYGAVNEDDKTKVQAYIEEFYHHGRISDFDKKCNLREKLISDYIGFSDGVNHVRFMSFLKEYIVKIESGEIKKRKWNVPIKTKIKGYMRHALFTLAYKFPELSMLKRWRQPYNIFSSDDFKVKKDCLYEKFDSFYFENESYIKDVYDNWNERWESDLGINK